MNGACDFCPRLGRLATCMCVHEHCVHEHKVGVWVCTERHAHDLAQGWIDCRICDQDVPHPHKHSCMLIEVVPVVRFDGKPVAG